MRRFLARWSFNARWSNSLEPVILFFWGGWFLVNGAEVGTDMLYRKICEVGMGEPMDACTNLTHHKELKLLVTKEVNLFTLYGNLLKFIPPILISLVGGTLFDIFPKKVFLIIPLLFASIEPLAEFLNFYLFYSLPVEFMYLTFGTWSLGGGTPMWYLAEYGYISLVARPEDRVGRLSRADAMESLAPIVMIPLSQPVFLMAGYCGIHGVKLAMYLAGLFYLFFVIQEPQIHTNVEQKNMTYLEICKKLATSIWDMAKTICKKRKGYMRALLFLQMVNFFLINIMITGLFYLNYQYVKAVFNITGDEFAIFKEVETISIFLCLLIIVPLVSKTFAVSDSVFLSFVCFSSSAGLFLASAATSYIWFCIGRLGIPLFYSTWLLLRSLLVSCIDPEEIGRVFGGIAVVAALAEYASDPVIRYIFDASIDGSYPGLFLLVMAVIFLLIGLNCTFLHFALARERRNTPEENQIQNEAAQENPTQNEAAQENPIQNEDAQETCNL